MLKRNIRIEIYYIILAYIKRRKKKDIQIAIIYSDKYIQVN